MTINTPDWINKWGSLLLGYAFIGSFTVGMNAVFGLLGIALNIGVVLSLGLVWPFVWRYLNSLPPRNRSKKFGIAIFITTEDAKMRARLENDLAKRLTEVINANQLHDTFELVLASSNKAKLYATFLTAYQANVSPYKSKSPPEAVPANVFKPFRKFQRRTNCHFFIWGSLVERKDIVTGGETAYTLQTDAIVVHSELLPNQQQLLKNQFAAWVKEFKINEKAEYQGLRFTADKVFLMANLTIGTSAALVGNLEAALALHQRLMPIIESPGGDFHQKAVAKHVKRMLVDEHLILSDANYCVNPDQSRVHINEALRLDQTNYGAYLRLARLQYEIDNDSKSALETTMRSKQYSQGEPIWRYNIAFLQLANGEYKEALKTYNKIIKTSIVHETEIVRSVIEFNLLQFSDRRFVPSLFVIGILAYKKIRNLPQALDYIEKFLGLAAEDASLDLLTRRASEYRSEILCEMEIEP